MRHNTVLDYASVAYPPCPMLESLIVGAGISGLTVAQTLKRSRTAILVTEAQDRVGGSIQSRTAEGFAWEEGPNSFQPHPALLDLMVELGLQDKLQLADRRLPRFVYWQDQLMAVPTAPDTALTTRLLSPTGKLRAALGALGFVPPIVGKNLTAQHGEETVWQFVERHLGREVAERLISPFVSGVYAGDVHQLSMAAAFRRVFRLETLGGGLIAGALLARRQRQPQPVNPKLPQTKPGELGSFAGGLKILPETIAAALGDRVRLNWRLVQLQRTPEQAYAATFTTPEGRQTVQARSLVLATPAHVSAQVLKEIAPQASQALREIPYPPVACVVLAYPTTALKRELKGFGNLIPRGQGIRTLGTIWTSSLFPDRAPAGWHLLTNFIGGATDRAIATLAPEDIAQAVHQDLSQMLVDGAVQPQVLSVRLWPQAIPQYTLGHLERLAQIEADVAQQPGLFLCSNFTDGVALGDCVRRGRETAAQVNVFLA